MLNEYFQRDSQSDDANTPVCAVFVGSVENEDICLPTLGVTKTLEDNSKVWVKVSAKFEHLSEKE